MDGHLVRDKDIILSLCFGNERMRTYNYFDTFVVCQVSADQFRQHIFCLQDSVQTSTRIDIKMGL